MNGIDTGAASLLASRIAALTPVGPQEAGGTTQSGVSALATGATALADTQQNAGATPQDSAQTVLSAVALALDAIIRSGGEATPAVMGRAPVWANPDSSADPNAAQADAATLPLPGMLAAEVAQTAEAAQAALLAALDGDANAATQTDAADPTQTTQTAQNAQGAAAAQAQSGPVAALAASLAQTVSTSGLFYEAHLAQWLRGQYSLAQLAEEPQNRLASGDTQLPLDWSQSADDVDDVQWIDTFSSAHSDAQAASRNDANAAARNLPLPGDARTDANGNPLLGSRDTPGRASLLADTLMPAHDGAAQAGNAAVHAATVPLVRQQLDMLATGEFRWNGEAWPGVRLDWSIQEDRYEGRDGRDGRPGGDDPTPWRTRLTLALPKLGTVDAELTLTGSTLAVRVQASEGRAARLNEHSEALRGRLEALGLTLAGFSIREVGSAADPLNAADAAKAASATSAYAAQTAAQTATHAATPTATQTATSAEASSAEATAAATDDWERG
ncbi:flagellar hook-length control protein FliK [Paraburkholderia acidisoli]|uniref:Flagellar hook-length control protein FliK n=1 Tax=Paraburkholderia acidisoli TaxID=2571748 RepID=A0A7Z2JEU0_9BURK|nr:flagellar hook-length control protein FliK [Paraburkholderia acidisoli]QGZ62647.1 flagellar hook-length control protein FliK [Paraburkholderia acidisoli]